MVDLPPDASSWDSGDWIDWLRHLENEDRPPCTAASEDPMARVLSVYEALLHAARSYRKLTGSSLGVDHAIAGMHCCIHHDMVPNDITTAENNRTLITHISPDAADDAVMVDLSDPFERVVVVRITEDFRVQSREVTRASLPHLWSGQHCLNWDALPDSDQHRQ